MPQGFRVFLIVWLGQLVSLTGSAMTGFALGVWVYQQTGSATHLALISLATSLPSILMSPLAGALVDRWDRRRVMVLSDAGAGLATLALTLLLFSARLQIWHIYLAVGIASLCQAFQWPAWTATTSLLVPREHLGRAAGMTQFGEAAAQIVAPVLAGALTVSAGLESVLVVDALTFACALLTLLAVRFPRPQTSAEGAMTARNPLWRQATFGWHYIRARPGLLGLLLLFAGINFTLGIVQVLFTPLVLSFASAAVLGGLMSFGGLGMLAGSLLMSVWGGPRRKVYGLMGFMALQGTLLIVAGWRTSIVELGAAVFLYFLAGPMVNGCSQAIWQAKVAADLQGRVFAIRRMIAWSSQPLAFVLAGPLVDHVFEPLLAVGGPLSGSVGRLIGVGPGRGIGLLYVVMGVLTVVAVALAYLHPRVRLVEVELPDADLSAADGPRAQVGMELA